MNNLDLYVAMIKTKLKENNITKETEMIKYVYLDLGNRFSFDANFILLLFNSNDLIIIFPVSFI